MSTQVTDLRAYLDRVCRITNFRCLTPPEALRGDCNYLCATLYACSVFGEHVLANLCLEQSADDQPVSGHVRIRAKTQGMAVTMGDKVGLLSWPYDLYEYQSMLGLQRNSSLTSTFFVASLCTND